MNALAKIKQTLSNMVDVHQQLLQLAQEKRAILVEGKVPKLQIAIGKESKYTDLIRHLEEQREQEVREFLSEIGLTIHSVTMDQLIKLVDDPLERSFLTKLTGQLRGIVHEVSQLNKNNQHLIEMALSYIQYSVNILMPKEPVIGYGMKSSVRSIKFLDAKV
ncbi:flagellar protein FlgN [Neobacillus ginsengisoli]|uniref:Flagellar biosynthesis/type III secretory pathway chaperone n=1 Tax=Neobacillus ginsengisoli TaxID=904295 RepID=A0ABT9XVG2_9BACI|nr:flagellar protein FlgN [Neobacillus ginsengisoli]MDQ0199567.1 flagellar biosynthesis/type III secretory pathway chaperone [Neobacillus ginsengisoli]